MDLTIKTKMASGFQTVEGGLFSTVTKADVGDGFASMQDKVTLMGWADPFYPDPSLPEHVMSAMMENLKRGSSTHYTTPIGSLELRQAIARRIKRFNHIDADPKRNIIVTPGSDSGLYFSMSLFINPGDEVLIPDPSYPNNFLNTTLLGGKIIAFPLLADDHFKIDIAGLEKRVTARTKMLVLTHPNNPTSTVFRRENLEALSEFIIHHDLILVVDQAFEDLVLDDMEFVSPANLPGMWERTVTVFSISKGMGLSGLRVGYILAHERIMDVLYGAAVNVVGATNTLSQIGAIAALENDAFIASYRDIFDRRRKAAFDLLSRVPGIRMALPESGFFSWVDVSGLGDSTEVMNYLIREARVAVNDGKNYGSLGDGWIRIVHGCLADDGEAMDSIKRIAAALEKYQTG
jgi:aspartate/methionine/tyrosine aminotransferase